MFSKRNLFVALIGVIILMAAGSVLASCPDGYRWDGCKCVRIPEPPPPPPPPPPDECGPEHPELCPDEPEGETPVHEGNLPPWQPNWQACDAKESDVMPWQMDEWISRCKPETAPPPPPPARSTCLEPSVYQRLYANGNIGIRLLTVGDLHPTDWELTQREFNSLDVSLTTDAKHFAYVQQDGINWQLYVAETEHPDNRMLVTDGLVSNPAINGENELVAFETADGAIEVRTWDGDLVRSISDSSQPFWYDQSHFGFVLDGMIYRSSVNSLRVVALTERGNEASEPVVSQNGNILAYTLNDHIVVMTNLETSESFTGAGDQPTINSDGSIMAYRGPNGQIFVYEDGVLTQVTNLRERIENPVLFCNRTIFFELQGEVNEVSYFAGMTARRVTNVIATSGQPESQPSFSASTIRTREHVRPEDWTIATATAFAQEFSSPEAFVTMFSFYQPTRIVVSG